MVYFVKCLQDPKWKANERKVLTELCSLFGAVTLEKRVGDLYEGGYVFPNSNITSFLREGIIMLCRNLVDNAVALIDVVAPPDFIINSPLGMSDGKVSAIDYFIPSHLHIIIFFPCTCNKLKTFLSRYTSI